MSEFHFKDIRVEERQGSDVSPAIFLPELDLSLAEKPLTRILVPLTEISDRVVVPAGESGNGDSPISIANASLEVEVIDLLNNAGAFMGEQISVQRTASGQIQVNALVETDKRKAELINALATVRNNPAIKINIETVAEAQEREAKRKRTPGGVTSVDMVQAMDNASPVYEDLRKRFTEAEARGYADRILRRGAQARRHALAMKQLSDRFSIADLASLNAAERAKWIGLLRGHAERFLGETAALERELQTVFPDLGGGAAQGVPGSDNELQASVRRLYELAVATDEDLRRAFAVFTNASSSAEVKTAKFWRTLDTVTAMAKAIQSAK